MRLKYSPLGDEHVLIEFGSRISERTLKNVMTSAEAVAPITNELKTAYTTLMVRFDPLEYEYCTYAKMLDERIKSADTANKFNPVTHKIETQYGGRCGQDLNRVAAYNNITEQQVVKLHTKNIYTVYMIGFLPGFCYLGGLNKRLYTPRLEVPRKKITKGSVGIADKQTGVYPLESPGGWNIIGITETDVFSVSEKGCRIKPGDKIRFVEV